jgi:hypothetical protein
MNLMIFLKVQVGDCYVSITNVSKQTRRQKQVRAQYAVFTQRICFVFLM